MSGECHYCHGLVLPGEEGDIVLDHHGDHRVYMHEPCGRGHNDIEAAGGGRVEVVCPECGTVETH
jgi:hypothetical protein